MLNTQLTPLDPAMIEPVARLIHHSATECADQTPLSFMFTPPDRLGVDETVQALRADDTLPELSVIALADGLPVSVVIARRKGDAVGWWRIVTDPECRGRGLAAGCLSVAEDALRATGAETVGTIDAVDSRRESMGRLLRSAGYGLEDPQQRSISMCLEMAGYDERDVVLADGHELVTYTDDDLQGWTDCRNRAFDTDAAPEWFVGQFASRADFDPAGWYMVKREGEVVAISGGLGCNDPCEPGAIAGGMIEYVGVVPESRGLGLGRAVVVACLNYLKRRGVGQTVLITQPFRVPAVKLYEDLGFVTFAAWHQYTRAL